MRCRAVPLTAEIDADLKRLSTEITDFRREIAA